MAGTAATNLSIAVKLINEAKNDLAKLDKDLKDVGDTAQKRARGPDDYNSRNRVPEFG